MRSTSRLRLPPRRAPLSLRAAALALALGLPLGLVAVSPASGGTRVAGNVATVDADRRELVIDDAGHQQTILVPENTPIFEGESPRPLESLRRGDRVVITIEENSPPRAMRISVAGPARSRRGEPLIRMP